MGIVRITLSLAMFLVMAKPAAAFDTGAPDSVCETLMPSHGAPPQQSPPPYQISVSRTMAAKGDQISVTLTGNDAFKGFFIRAKQNDAYIGGSFQENSSVSLRCNNQGMTHSSAAPKTTLVIVYTVTDDVGEVPLHFEATFVQEKSTFWTGVKSADIMISAIPTMNTPVNQEGTSPASGPNFQDPNANFRDPNSFSPPFQRVQDTTMFSTQSSSNNQIAQNPNSFPQPTVPSPVFQDPNAILSPKPTNPNQRDGPSFPPNSSTNNPMLRDPNGFPQQPNRDIPISQDPNFIPPPSSFTPTGQNLNNLPQPSMTSQGLQEPRTSPPSSETTAFGQNPSNDLKPNGPRPTAQNPNANGQPVLPTPVMPEPGTVPVAAPPTEAASSNGMNNRENFDQPTPPGSTTNIGEDRRSSTSQFRRPESLPETRNKAINLQVGAGWALISMGSLLYLMK